MTLISLALHDREELIPDVLASLTRADAMWTLSVVADAPDFDPTPYNVGHHFDVTETPQGPAAARNISLRYRKPGEDFLILDSDVVFQTDGWLKRMNRALREPKVGAVSPVLGPPWFAGIVPGLGLAKSETIPGLKLIRGAVMDRMGFVHPYGRYGYEDLDLNARIQGLGFNLVFDTEVTASHSPAPLENWKRQDLEDYRPIFNNWEKCYAAGQFLYWPEEGYYIPDNNPRWLDPNSKEETYGSHLPYLKWAVEQTDGPILEVGTGMYSTPYLLSLDREVTAVETNRRWRELAESKARPGFTVAQSIPEGSFSVALVDGHESERVETLRSLADRVDYLVVHDTEDVTFYPGMAEELEEFKYRADFDEAPRTTIVSNFKRIRRQAAA